MAYEVPDGLLAGRKAVRCVRCGTEWAPAPPADDEVPPEGFPDPVRPVFAGNEPGGAPPRLAPKVDRPGRSPGLRVAWAASVLVLVAGLAAAAIWHDRIAQVWPPSLRVYAALGLAHNTR
ncbi:MAG: hypothetical protein ACREFY_03430 [Acetobacteraceae bacterium]